ncbi:chloride channel protein 3 [Didymella exigua CBS 183.55]|uniref:Chloride channel protein n=1 Tax=Didymella exigua CBS 183.55 TaxID=1150837 RepID=A0A6A5RP63_9PLEO|nr:chloride channel protein 3 [Didymella exigua CBS 183.55]KAF1928076.1 chloride channel protein 3 [Didymella exigua CBS 183.55]
MSDVMFACVNASTTCQQPRPHVPFRPVVDRTSALSADPTPTTDNAMTPSLRRRNTSAEIQSHNHDDADAASTAVADAVMASEIAEIKRYEDFTTIDWVQDAARESLRRRARRRALAAPHRHTGRVILGRGRGKWRRKMAEAYDAGQAWIVVTLVGAAIGLNAAMLNIVTEWLSDIKLGYCSTAFYLNESFCCWGAEGGCAEWKRWSHVWPVNYVLYMLFAALFALTAATLVKSFAPYAAGSGISEMKCIIAGFVMKGFLGATTLFIKSIGLPLAIASGLSVGKEGPSVHYAVCTGNVISRFFDKYRRNAAKTREILSASAAAGVGVAFGSPIGGVLFSLEEMCNHFPLKTMWRSYFCALVATAVLAAMNPFRTGQLVMFQVRYDRSWHFFEVVFYLVIGAFGGLYGAFVIKWNLKMQVFRKRYLSAYPVTEAVVLAVATAVICYPNMFLRIDMTESMEILFQECEGEHDYNQLCDRDRRWQMVASLFIAFTLRTLLVIISFGCKVPAGIFVPSMAVGAAFGRMVGILVEALYESFPSSAFFSACLPDEPCITPGTYAFLGAAATLSGIMHITVSVVVIMFEITGALTYILPTMLVVGVTKAVSERFGHGGIADRMIYLNGYPFLDSKHDTAFGVPVSTVMARDVVCLPATGWTLRHLEATLRDNTFQGYPVVSDLSTRTLLGYIGRVELQYALDRARNDTRASLSAGVSFAPSPSSSSSLPETDTINFAKFLDPTPLTVHPRLPLDTVMQIFHKMGPRAVLIEHRGRLAGLVTVKDCLRYEFQAEATQHNSGGGGAEDEDERMEALFRVVKRVAGGVDAVWRGVLGRVGLGRGRRTVAGRADGGGGGGGGAFVAEGGGEELVDRGRAGVDG